MTTIGERTLVSTIHDRFLIEDDTEESVSGSDFHLAAILALYDVLLRYAMRTARTWYVTAEVMVLADVPDRSRNPWRPMPDVYVVLNTPSTPRTSLDTRTDAPFPQFICEVASESTWGQDVGEKQRLYADLGTLEYVAFDPTGEFLGESVRAWHRMPDGNWGPWRPDAEGFFTSEALDGLRLRAEGHLLRVHEPGGERLPTAQELEQLAHYQADQLADQADQLADQGQQLAEERAKRRALEEEIARLRQGGR